MSALLQPVELWPHLCPRTNYDQRSYPRCAKPLTDFKCPKHGLIREVMPK
jgi:hypothetical protein